MNKNLNVMIKIILTTVLLILSNFLHAQLSIGKQDFTNPNILLDFENPPNNAMGIILPAVTNSNLVIPSNGTFIFDTTLNKVRMYENNGWKDLTGIGSSTGLIPNNSNESAQNQGVILGAESSNANGVLILESSDKAMVLPKIANPHLSVKSPYPGMMCYDTVSKSLAVFDGANWSYWK